MNFWLFFTVGQMEHLVIKNKLPASTQISLETCVGFQLTQIELDGGCH